jgi:hypothetical protein
MKTKKSFIRRKLLIALFILIFVSCNIDESTSVIVQKHADIDTAKTEEIFDQNEMHEEMEIIESSAYISDLIDILMDDGGLGWCPIIYEKRQKEQEALAKADVEAGALLNTKAGTYGEYQVSHPATQTTNQIIIYIVADRYTDTEQEEFFYDAQNMANSIWTIPQKVHTAKLSSIS